MSRPSHRRARTLGLRDRGVPLPTQRIPRAHQDAKQVMAALQRHLEPITKRGQGQYLVVP